MGSLSEQQRRAYLAAMGIQAYFPRRALPGAKASPVYESGLAPLLDPPQTTGSTVAAPPSKAEPVAARPVQAERGTKTLQVSETTDSALRFKLRYFSINQTLSIVDEIPYLQGDDDGGRSVALLQAILRALQVTPANDAYQAEFFNWPLTEMPAVQANELERARQAMDGFIRRRFEIHGFKCLLVFSSQLDQVFLPVSSPPDTAHFSYPALGFDVTLSKSLHAMLTVPALKKTVWQDLQAVRTKLAAGHGNES